MARQLSIHSTRPLALACALLIYALPAAAIPFDFTWSGFASGIAGYALGGSHQDFLSYHCPCYIANWEHAEVYENKGWMANQESLVGVQGSLKLLPSLKATMQLVGRASTEKITPDWAYLSYTMNGSWRFDVGRQRLPFYSDSAYIGYTYPWVRPPPEVYGWQIYDYDGAAVVYNTDFGDWGFRASGYGGRRSSTDNIMENKLSYGYPIDEKWYKILGGYAELSNDYVSARVIYQHNKIDRYGFPPDDVPTQILSHAPQQFASAAFTADYDNFIWRSEVQMLRQPQQEYNSFSYLLSGGYRYRQITGMLTQAWYYERTTTDYPAPERFHSDTVSLRWDFRKSWDAKVQLDMFHDYSGAGMPFLGGSRLLSVAVDTVF
jgi:hypothetical protein